MVYILLTPQISESSKTKNKQTKQIKIKNWQIKFFNSKQPGYQALFNMVERNIVIHCEH